MDKLVAIRIKHNDGTYSNEIPLSVLAINIDWDGTHSLVDVLGNVDLNKGSIQEQINALITTITPDNVQYDLTHTLSDVLGDVDLDKGDLQTQIDNISDGEIQVDSTLTAAGKAADAKAVGDNLKNVVRVGNSNVTNFTSIILGDTAEQVNLLDQSDLININARLSALEGGDIQTDQTLSVQGMAADAKATGDAIHNLQGLVGTPLVAATAASMTNTDKIYVYTGSETGYTNGNWYYYDGTAWVSGGVYNSIAMNMDSLPTLGSSNPVTSGGIKAALDLMDEDISSLNEDITDLKSAITNTRDGIDITGPAYTLTANKAMTTQTTSLVDSQLFSIVDPIAISKGETIEVTCSTFATTFGIIATCNSDNTSRTIIVTSDGNDGTRYEYTATADGYVCLLTRNGEAPDIIIFKKISQQIETLESEITNLQSELSYNENFIKGLANHDNIELTIHKGSFYTNNVVYTEYPQNQNFQTAEITGIDPFHYYHISASSAYGNTVYAFLDSGGNVLEKVLDTTGSGAGTDFDGNVKAPANASILRVGTCRGDDTLYVGEVNGVEPHDASVLSGVRWAVFGDSLTEVNATATKKYYDWIAERTGIIPVNYGSSGTGYYSSYDDDKAFFQRMANIDPDDFDFMTIFGSGNDIKFLKQNTLPLGTCDDYGNLNAMPTTMGAAINRTIEQYYALSPIKPLALITPTPWNAYCTGWRMNRDDAVYMQDYSDLIIQIAKIRGIPCLNLFNESGFRPWSNEFKIEYYNENGVQDGGTHPNSKGHKLLSYQFEQFIKKVF